MNDTKEIKPTAALVVYDDYLEVHQIIDGKFGPGKPCTEEAIKKLQKVLLQQNKSSYSHLKGIVPPNMIYLDSDVTKPVLIWRTEKHKQKLLFSKSTGIASGQAEVPNMIWMFKDESLTVYAYKEWLGMDTVLYYVPLPNTNQGGVCLGNVKIKKDFDSIEDAIKSAESYYWQSTFTHKMDSAWTIVWNEAIKMKKDEFQDCNLRKETKYKTLKKFINEQRK